MAGKNLFSKEALDKLRTPEKLDALIEITDPVGWMALAAMVVMILSVITWSIFGAMVDKVEGVGILLDSAGVVSVSTVSSGRVEDVLVKTGMRVKKGDLLATLEHAQQKTEIKLARSDMRLSSNKSEALARASQYDAKLSQEDISSLIFSEDDGIVDEVAIRPGAVVSAGSQVITIRRDQKRKEITGIMYVSVKNGKRIEPGMTIQLAPNGVDVSESGSLLAVARSVSQYPVSANAMQNKLGNQQFVQWVLNSSDSAVMEVEFDLVRDESSPSGYLWTSVVGKQKQITAGSTCTGFVIVDRKPPIEKVFYKFSQWLRSR